MQNAFRIRKTDELPDISSSDTPTIPLRDDEIEEYKNQLIFNAISGQPESIADKDTIETAIIIRKECRSQFIGMSPSALNLCRSSIQYHQDIHSGAMPERIYIAEKMYKMLAVQMEYIYGGPFNGKLPLPLALHRGNTIYVMIDNSVDGNTVTCIHWSLKEYYNGT